jgi:uncharacterized protein (DUF427 family)
VGDVIVDNVVWSYEQPMQEIAGLRGLLAFYRDRLDSWHE